MNVNYMRLGLVMLLGITPIWIGAHEVDADDLPPAVLSAVKGACPDGTIEEILKEKCDDVMVYEVEMKLGRMGCDLKIASDGTLLEKEQQIAPKELPKKVKATLAKFKELKIRKAERVKEKDEGVFFELDVVLGEQVFELKITKKGMITEIEFKGSKHADGDDDDDADDDDGDDDDNDD